jgi:hypothetical protein
VSTPWPAFSIVASNSGHFLSGQDHRAADMFRHRFLPALAEGAAFFKSNTLVNSSKMRDISSFSVDNTVIEDNTGSDLQRDIQFDSNAVCDDSVALIVKRFGHQQIDAQRWLDKTVYALPDMSVDAERMRRALHTLQKVGLVPEVYPVKQLWGGAADVLCNDAISFRHGPAPIPLTAAGLMTAVGSSHTAPDKYVISKIQRSALML